MKKVVASASFARYPALKQMLTELEQMYREILALQPPARGGDTSGGSGGAASAPDLGSRAEIREPEALDGLEPTGEGGGAAAMWPHAPREERVLVHAVGAIGGLVVGA